MILNVIRADFAFPSTDGVSGTPQFRGTEAKYPCHHGHTQPYIIMSIERRMRLIVISAIQTTA